MLNTKQS